MGDVRLLLGDHADREFSKSEVRSEVEGDSGVIDKALLALTDNPGADHDAS